MIVGSRQLAVGKKKKRKKHENYKLQTHLWKWNTDDYNRAKCK
jgi:hypothetical protein